MKVINKIKTRNARFAHITRGGEGSFIGYEKRDPESRKEIEWTEPIEGVKICMNQENLGELQFRSLFLDREIVNLLPYVEKFEIWPVANEYSLRERGVTQYAGSNIIDIVMVFSSGAYIILGKSQATLTDARFIQKGG